MRLAAVVLARAVAGCGDSSGTTNGLTADDIPVAHTPAGGFRETFPAPVLARCTEPLVRIVDMGGGPPRTHAPTARKRTACTTCRRSTTRRRSS